MNEEDKDYELNVDVIKTLRKLNGITQEELAIKAKVNRHTIIRLENDPNIIISLPNLQRICKALGARLIIAFDVDKIIEKKELKDGTTEDRLFGSRGKTA